MDRLGQTGDQRQAAEQVHRAIDARTRAGEWATVGKAHGALALDAHWSGDTRDGIAMARRPCGSCVRTRISNGGSRELAFPIWG